MVKSGPRVASAAALAVFGALLVVVSPPPPDQPARGPMTSINPLIGDESFVATFGREPSHVDDDELRLRTHLSYVERRLRAADDTALPEPLRAARRRNLDLLHAYWSAGMFPAGESRAGRQPTFIDDAGRRCAVAALVEAAAGTAAIARINERYRNAYIGQMRDDGLAAWIASSGLTPDEVAMIQPNYRGRRELERWQVAADVDPLYLVRITGPQGDEGRPLPALRTGLRVFDLKYAWLAGARATIGRSLADGGTYYDADLHVGYVAVSEGRTSLLFKVGGGVDGMTGAVPFGVTVPFGLALGYDLGERRPVLQLRGEGKWAVWSNQRDEALTWTAALDTIWRRRLDYAEKFYAKDLIVGLFATRLGGQIYGGITLGLGFRAHDSVTIRDVEEEGHERYREVLRAPYE